MIVNPPPSVALAMQRVQVAVRWLVLVLGVPAAVQMFSAGLWLFGVLMLCGVVNDVAGKVGARALSRWREAQSRRMVAAMTAAMDQAAARARDEA